MAIKEYRSTVAIPSMKWMLQKEDWHTIITFWSTFSTAQKCVILRMWSLSCFMYESLENLG